jgi:hypothetical protein
VFLTLAVLVANFTGESPPLIRKRVSEVQFTLVATDRNDRPLPSLSPADITVLEDGHPIPHSNCAQLRIFRCAWASCST